MCLHADPSARGSVLEAEGLVEIKFRKHELKAMMRRLDPTLKDLAQQQQAADGAAAAHLAAQAAEREAALLPTYHAVALQYAGMHETPVRPPLCVGCFVLKNGGLLCIGGVRGVFCAQAARLGGPPPTDMCLCLAVGVCACCEHVRELRLRVSDQIPLL